MWLHVKMDRTAPIVYFKQKAEVKLYTHMHQAGHLMWMPQASEMGQGVRHVQAK